MAFWEFDDYGRIRNVCLFVGMIMNNGWGGGRRDVNDLSIYPGWLAVPKKCSCLTREREILLFWIST